jgi:hypothetical protein
MADAKRTVEHVYTRESSDPRVIVAEGYGVAVRVVRGQLTVEDGVGRTRRTRSYLKSDRTLERIVILSADGMVTLEAAEWCADRGVTIIAACRDASGFGSG